MKLELSRTEANSKTEIYSDTYMTELIEKMVIYRRVTKFHKFKASTEMFRTHYREEPFNTLSEIKEFIQAVHEKSRKEDPEGYKAEMIKRLSVSERIGLSMIGNNQSKELQWLKESIK